MLPTRSISGPEPRCAFSTHAAKSPRRSAGWSRPRSKSTVCLSIRFSRERSATLCFHASCSPGPSLALRFWSSAFLASRRARFAGVVWLWWWWWCWWWWWRLVTVALDGGGSDGGGEATHHGGAFQCGGVGGVFAWLRGGYGALRCVALRCGGRGGGEATDLSGTFQTFALGVLTTASLVGLV
jgi:hypothetical protein